MPFIQNVARSDVRKGNHKIPKGQSVWIQIADPDCDFIVATHQFTRSFKFKFLDLEDDPAYDNSLKISDADAEAIVDILKNALTDDMDVIVNCHVGACRSGAVCEVGVMMGFDDTGVFRSPNTLVKTKLLKALQLDFDPSMSAFNDHQTQGDV